MNTNICILVYAKSKSSAADEAQRVATTLTDNLVFDHVEADSGFRADSKRGKALIEQGMGNTRSDFMEILKKVRSILTRNKNEGLYLNEHDLANDIRYWGACLDSAHRVYLFDDDGEAIHTPAHLQDVLAKWPGHDKVKEGDVWVFDAYTHY